MFAARRPIVSSIASAAAGRRAYSRMTIIGRLGKEPAPFTSAAGDNGLHLYIASANRDQQQTTSWYRVATFANGQRQEYIKSLPKGSLVHVECDARLRQITTEDNNGPAHIQLDLVERHVSLLAKPRSHFDQQNQEQAGQDRE